MTDASNEQAPVEPRKSLSLETVILGFAALLAIALVAEEIPRVLFPWDLRSFAESPFMTDMLKLSAGHGPYGDPADCNSFLYAPGLEYLSYALLRPLGAALDIRACRAVCVGIGFASAAVAGHMTTQLVRALGKEAPGQAARWIATFAAALVIFRNYTADACHPDNLYGLHAMAVIALCYRGARSQRFADAILAVTVAALGVIAKQTGGLGVVGATLVLVWLCRERWGLWRSLLLAAIAAACCGSFVWLAFHGHGWFWGFQLVSRQPMEWERYHRLVAHVLGQPHRLLLWGAFAPCVVYVAMQPNRATRTLLAVWMAVGVTEVLPSIVSYFKAWAFWNDLVIVDLWASVPVVATLLHAARIGRKPELVGLRAAAGGTLLTLLATLVPTRIPPTRAQYEFGRALDADIARAKADGKRVLVTDGASTLIHNGLLDPPLDRALSASELGTAGIRSLPATRARLLEHRYDRLYILGPSYSEDVVAAVHDGYHEVGTIPGEAFVPPDADLFAIHSYMHEGVRILEGNRE